MYARIKRLWVDDLRAGVFKQAGKVLSDGNDGRCCLGVLCEIYSRETGNAWEPLATKHGEETLPPEVSEWAGLLPDLNPMLGEETASGCNDSLKESFAQIADRIEKYL